VVAAESTCETARTWAGWLAGQGWMAWAAWEAFSGPSDAVEASWESFSNAKSACSTLEYCGSSSLINSDLFACCAAWAAARGSWKAGRSQRMWPAASSAVRWALSCTRWESSADEGLRGRQLAGGGELHALAVGDEAGYLGWGGAVALRFCVIGGVAHGEIIPGK
jgi:hypothetical protein